MDTSSKRVVAGGGLLFFVILALAVLVAPNTPSTNATAEKVVTYYHAHRAVMYLVAYLIVLAVIVGMAYFWYLHEHLAKATEDRRMLTVGFAGAIIFAISGLVEAGLKFTLADGSHAGNIPGATLQALNLIQSDLTTVIGAAGTALFLIFTGLAIVRAGGLPRWLGWVGVVFGVISATGFVGPIAVGLWILIASITMLVRGDSDSAGAPATSPASQADGA